MTPLKTAILIIVYNRPELARRVIASLTTVSPEKIYVAADGPNPRLPHDTERCNQTRSLFVEKSSEFITWPCQIKTFFQSTNLGCRAGVTAALDWFFEQEEEGIVLEDDIVADPSFFPFCQELLERYRHDERVGVISANNHQRLPQRWQQLPVLDLQPLLGLGQLASGLALQRPCLKGLAGFSRWSMARATGGRALGAALGPMVGAARGWADRHLGHGLAIQLLAAGVLDRDPCGGAR